MQEILRCCENREAIKTGMGLLEFAIWKCTPEDKIYNIDIKASSQPEKDNLFLDVNVEDIDSGDVFESSAKIKEKYWEFRTGNEEENPEQKVKNAKNILNCFTKLISDITNN